MGVFVVLGGSVGAWARGRVARRVVLGGSVGVYIFGYLCQKRLKRVLTGCFGFVMGSYTD